MSNRLSNVITRLMWVCMAFSLVVQLSASPAQRTLPFFMHHLSKRSFFGIQCKGVYDKSIFARLDRICEDCYNLFREPELHTLCKSKCFSTDYFQGCVEALLQTDEQDTLKKMVEYIGK